MPFNNEHTLLTFGGGLASGNERWSCGIRFSASVTLTQAMANSTVAPLKAFYSAAPPSFHNSTFIDFAKLAPQDVNGLYPAGLDAVDAVFGTATAGASSTGVIYPPQVCTVITHKSSIARGRGALGRVYLPPPAAAIGATGTLSTGTADGFLSAYRTLLLALNALGFGVATVKSRFGQSAPIVELRCGLVLDTHRSRRRSLSELPRTLAV